MHISSDEAVGDGPLQSFWAAVIQLIVKSPHWQITHEDDFYVPFVTSILLNGEPSIELGRNALALTKLLGLGIALKGDGESRRTRCVRTLTAESETYKYMHYYQIW